MSPSAFSAIPGQRAAIALVLAGAALLLSACATPPPPPPVETRAQALQHLGFEITQEGWAFSLDGKLLFSTDSDQLDAQTQATADRLGRGLATLRIETVRVEGHTDDIGPAAYNLALSQRRASAVVRAKSLQPVLPNDTPGNRQQNRRVSVIVPAQ